MEFVIVTFVRPRVVNVDGAARGRTGQPMRLQTGTHSFDLGVPADYTPSNVLQPIRGSSQSNPMIIAFAPLALRGGGPLGMAKTAGKRKAARKRTRTTARKTAATASKKTARKTTTRKTRARKAKQSRPR